MTCWVRLLFIGLVIGNADPTLALQGPSRLMKNAPTMSSRAERGICFCLFSTRNSRCFATLSMTGTLFHQPAREQGQEGPPGSRSAQPSNERVVDGEVIGPRVPARPEETCIVCNNPVGPDDSVYLVQGQRVPVHAREEGEFLSHPQKYLMRLKPLGGALLGADSNQPGMANRAGSDRPEVSRAWIYSGLYVLLGVVFAAACAHRALHTGYSPGAWFGLGLVLNAFAYILLMTRPKREVLAPAGVPLGLGKIAATHAPQRCPKCGAFNHPAAVHCLACGASLSPGVESEVSRVGLRSA